MTRIALVVGNGDETNGHYRVRAMAALSLILGLLQTNSLITYCDTVLGLKLEIGGRIWQIAQS